MVDGAKHTPGFFFNILICPCWQIFRQPAGRCGRKRRRSFRRPRGKATRLKPRHGEFTSTSLTPSSDRMMLQTYEDIHEDVSQSGCQFVLADKIAPAPVMSVLNIRSEGAYMMAWLAGSKPGEQTPQTA